MRRRTVCAVMLASLLFCGPALADDPAAPVPAPAAPVAKPLAESLMAAAKTDYDVGKILFRDGDFAGALVKFQSSYDKSKDARLLYNVAACERNLHHYARALRAMTRYQKDAALSDEDKKEAEQIVVALKPLVGAVAVVSLEAGASVSVDGELFGETPLAEPVQVDFGKHKVRVTKAGFTDAEMDVEVNDTSTSRTEVVLEKPEGRLVVQARPEDRIDVDGKFVSMGRLEVTLPYGGHTLRVTATGYRTYQSEVNVQGKQRTMEVTLEKEKSGGLPWWAWAAGGVVIAGAGTATVVALTSGGSSSHNTTNTTSTFTPVPGTAGGVTVHGVRF